jgi:hypothetical protein
VNIPYPSTLQLTVSEDAGSATEFPSVMIVLKLIKPQTNREPEGWRWLASGSFTQKMFYFCSPHSLPLAEERLKRIIDLGLLLDDIIQKQYFSNDPMELGVP